MLRFHIHAKQVRSFRRGVYCLHLPRLDEQIRLERDAIALGLKKLHKNTMDLEGNEDYASASVYGAASIDTLLPLVVARIESTTIRLRKGQAGAAFKDIQQAS